MEVNSERISKSSGVPLAPPLPTLEKEEPYNESKNLMKSAATLLGKKNNKLKRVSALDICQRFLVRFSKESNVSWYYHNNDVEACLQDGPTCGLVALKLAADILNISKSTTDEIEELLKVAQESGLTYHGEMFSARDMGLLAENYYELKFKVVSLDDHVQLVKHLYKGFPVLVPYDADRNHEPCLRQGHKAHWAVLTGFLVGVKNESISSTNTCEDSVPLIHPFRLDSILNFDSQHLSLLARQGKSRHYAVWPWIDLNNSNKNLVEFSENNINNDEYSGESGSDKMKCMFTEGMQAGLCGKIVFLFPQI